MYGVKYKVPFKTLSGRDSVVTLEERGYAGSVIELTAGGTPFTINTDQSDLLTPIRSSTATLSVVGSDYLQDLYVNDPQGIRVKCEVGGEVKWLGYLLPDTFSQDFTHPEFIYEMECVSALSTLKYKDFDLTSGFVSFLDIIKKARDYAGYNELYLTNETSTSSPWYNLKISTSNFYDELGEAMNYYEVLEEIAKYLGLTIVPHEDDLYFIDYFAIKNDFISYSRVVGNTISGTLERDAKSVTEYKGTGAKLSRIAGKNKAVVNCSLYETDKDAIQFNDEGSTLIDSTETHGIIKNGKEYIEIRRNYKTPRFDMYNYSYNYASKVRGGAVANDGELYKTGIGSQFIRSTKFEVGNEPTKLSFETELLVRRYTSIKTDPSNQLFNTDPILTLRSPHDNLMFEGVYFCISLDLEISQKMWSESDFIEKAKTDMVWYQHAKFRIGDKYWDGNNWVTTEATFEMPITIKKDSQMNETYLTLDNNNNYLTGVGNLEGYTFKSEGILMGKAELTLFAFEDSRYIDPFYTFQLDAIHRYKNIQLEYAVPDAQSIYGDWVSKDSKNDLIYENKIDDDYIEPADEIDLKICTRPDGKVGLACVLDGNDFLKKITSKVFGTDIAENILLKKVIELYKKPRFVIDPVLENNAKPYTIFTEPHLNKKFMVAGGEEDVKMESTRYNLIEI